MSKREEILSRVIDIAVKTLNLKKESISEKSSFVEDLGADSLDVVEFVMALEDEYSIKIDENDAQSIKTVADAVNYIEKKIV